MSDIQFITRVGKNQTSGAPRGQKRPFRPREVWAIRARLEMLGEIRNLALLNLAIDSKLRGCDLVRLKVSDVFSAGSVRERAMITHKKTSRPVQFEITKLTATSLVAHVQKIQSVKIRLFLPKPQRVQRSSLNTSISSHR